MLLYQVWAYGWTLACCRCTEISGFHVPRGLHAGDTMPWNLVVHNRLPYPLAWCTVSWFPPARFLARSNGNTFDPGEAAAVMSGFSWNNTAYWQRAEVACRWIPAGGNKRVSLELQGTARGLYYIPPAQVMVGDPSGLYRGKIEYGAGQTLPVYPRFKAAPGIARALAPGENLGPPGAGLENYYEFRGVREYQLHDPIKSINWYASARTGSLKTNLYETRPAARCLIAFDVSVAGRPPVGEPPDRLDDAPLEKALSSLAGLAAYYLERGATISLVTNSPFLSWVKTEGSGEAGQVVRPKRNHGLTTLPYRSGKEQLHGILKVLASVDETDRARSEEQAALWKLIRKMHRYAVVYLVCYHRPPSLWELPAETGRGGSTENNPASFYSPDRLRELSAPAVKLINLGEGAE